MKLTYQQAMNRYRELLVRAAIHRAGSRRRAARDLGMTLGNLSRLIRRAVILDLPQRGDVATRFTQKSKRGAA